MNGYWLHSAEIAPLHIDKTARFPYPRAFGRTAAALIFGAWRPFLSIL